jgi:hypothetical protein
MRKCWIDDREYWLHDGCWVPRSHFYDYGEEPIYLGPRRGNRRGRGTDLFGFAACCIVGGYVLGKLLGY